MAVTGVNNYSNIYTNAYTGNIWKNNAKAVSYTHLTLPTIYSV